MKTKIQREEHSFKPAEVDLCREAVHSVGNYVEKTDNFLACRRWLGLFKFYPEVGLESANFTG